MENKKEKTDWTAFDALTDEDIEKAVAEDPDTFLTDEAFWKDAQVTIPENKQAITLLLDPKIIAFFKEMGDYQLKINSILKTYVDKMERKA